MKSRPTELELQVLGVLWDHGPSPVREVLEKLPDGKPRAYTTVLSILQGMERKKLVAHSRDGLAHVYRAVVTRNDVAQPVLSTLLRNMFAGDPAKVVQALVESDDLTAEDLKEMRRLISQAVRKAEIREDGHD